MGFSDTRRPPDRAGQTGAWIMRTRSGGYRRTRFGSSRSSNSDCFKCSRRRQVRFWWTLPAPKFRPGVLVRNGFSVVLPEPNRRRLKPPKRKARARFRIQGIDVLSAGPEAHYAVHHSRRGKATPPMAKLHGLPPVVAFESYDTNLTGVRRNTCWGPACVSSSTFASRSCVRS